jgi:hypothetical protein
MRFVWSPQPLAARCIDAVGCLSVYLGRVCFCLFVKTLPRLGNQNLVIYFVDAPMISAVRVLVHSEIHKIFEFVDFGECSVSAQIILQSRHGDWGYLDILQRSSTIVLSSSISRVATSSYYE